jgi:hypothetical protein
MKSIVFVLLSLCFFSFFAQAKRAAPTPVKPISNAGLRYEALEWAFKNKAMEQNGGYVRVVNIKNGFPICTKRIYETKYDKNLESDIQDNFITSLKIEGQDLVITSERLSPIRKPLANFCD